MVFFLPTFALDKSKISQIVKILREYSKFLGLMNDMIGEKMIIVKKNWPIVKNRRIAMYGYTGEITEIYTFKWLELITGFFHLQMTILKTFLQILWCGSRDAGSLSQCHNTLRRLKVFKDRKNSYI